MADAPQTPPELDNQVPDAVEVSVWSARRKMAWVSLWGIIIPTAFVLLRVTNVQLLDKFAELLSWYYLSLASIVGAFFGFTAWASIKGRGGE